MKIYYLVLLVFFSCKSSDIQIKKAQEIYLNHLQTIESFVKVESNSIEGNTLDEAILFLESITSISSSVTQNYDPQKFPSQQNLDDWKMWYSENKQLLYWDDLDKKVKIKSR